MTDTAQHLANRYRKRVPVIRDSRAPVAKAADIAGVEWVPVRDEAHRSSTRVFDSRAFPSLQDAIDTAHAAGGGEVFVGDTVAPGLDIVLKDGVYLTGRGVGSTSIAVRTITGAGHIEPLPGLLTATTRHARSITFASAPDLEPGDVFILYNPTNSSFNTARPYYRAGEFCRVRSISGNTVHLTKPLYGLAYSPAVVEAHKVHPIRTGVSNMSVRCTQGQTGITVTYGTDLVFRNLTLDGTDVSHLTLSRCYNVDLDNVKAFDASPAIGLNYGVSIVNCQRVRINNVDLETTRHGLTMTGDNQPCSVPNRDIQINDSYISGMTGDLGVCGLNLHGNCEYITIDNVTMPSGINPAGDYITVRNSDISSAPWGSAVSTMELLGVSLTFENNTFRATANHDAARGLVALRIGETATRSVGHLRFIRNMVDVSTYLSNTAGFAYGVYIQTLSSSGASARYLEINGNTFYTALGSGELPNPRGARIRNDSGMDQWNRVDALDNAGNMPIVASESGTPMLFRGYGGSVPDFVAAPGSTYHRRVIPGTNAGSLYINKNGDTNWTLIG